MASTIDHINLIDGLNLNPISLEAGNDMTTTKWLMAIQSKVNSIIDMGNTWETNANTYADNKASVIQKELDDLIVLLNNGNIIPDGSIDLKKLKTTFISDLQDLILKYVHDSSKFVAFGIDKNGYFFADMPDSWDDIIFSTDTQGCLCLNITT
jgi:hypothetical protein